MARDRRFNLNYPRVVKLPRTLTLSLLLAIIPFASGDAWAADKEQYGPPNLLRSMRTPFSGGLRGSSASADDNPFQAITLGNASIGSQPERRTVRPSAVESLRSKLLPPTLYMPEHLQIGQPAHFSIKANPGFKAAVAMADSNEGASPVLGQPLRLGADRKVVAVGKIPESGILEVVIGTPIQGDLIGANLYFEAAVWSEDDMSDMALARIVSLGGQSKEDNGVPVAAAPVETKKKGIRIVPTASMPMSQTRGQGLSSGRP